MVPVPCIYTNTTLCAHAVLIEDLLNKTYQYVITARLQSDPVEEVFPSTDEWMAVGFLSILQEVRISEKILQYYSLLKENINFWEEDRTYQNQECVSVTEDTFGTRRQEIMERVVDENSVEVTNWYVAKKFIKRSRCKSCKDIAESWR